MTNNMDDKENCHIEQILGRDQSWRWRRRVKIWAGWAVPVLVIIIVISVFYSRSSRKNPVQYKTQKVRRGGLTVTVTATGNLQPTDQVDVGVEVSGTIETVEVDYNDQVTEGQVLARLDISKLQAQVLQARAALESARAKVLKTKANAKQTQIKMSRLKRARKLSGGKVPSPTEMDIAEANLRSALADEAAARAEVAEAKATLKFHETELSKAVIRSPVDGIVLSRHVEPGQTVAASLQTPVLFTLAEDLRKMELHVDVDEADVGQIKEGQRAIFTVDAYPNRTFSAQVSEARFAPKTVEGVVTYETVLNVDNSDLALRPGMTATAEIVVKQVKNALLIPNAALRFSPPVQAQKKTGRNEGLVSLLLPHRPRRPSPEKKENVLPQRRKRLVWRLQNGKPIAILVTVGATDGQMTEVLAGDIRPGIEVLTEAVFPEK